MEYRKYGEAYYVRLDRDDEIISSVLNICKTEGIHAATFSGIGGCGKAEIQTFIPETGLFETNELQGMLELISLSGNIITDDDGEYYHHTHALFSYKNGDQHCVSGGHIKSILVSYTAEIELRPVVGGGIKRKFDPETGTGFWDFR